MASTQFHEVADSLRAQVRLYLEESFSAELSGPEAAVPLLSTEDGDERLARARVDTRRAS